MSQGNPNLIGPAASVMGAVRELIRRGGERGLAVLLEGDPGVGKTHACDAIAMELAGCAHAIERVNGQSLSVDLVRAWRAGSAYGNLFSPWTVKRIDEIDQASPSAMAEMLSHLDYLPPRAAILATTNEFAKLRALCKGRLETRFVRFHVDAPTVDETARLIVRARRIPLAVAREIAAGAVPEGCLETVGCNVRAALRDAEAYAAAVAAQKGGR